MHRFGQQFRRNLLKPDTEDTLHGTTGKEVWEPHIQMLRATIEELGGEEIRRKVQEGGQDAVLKELVFLKEGLEKANSEPETTDKDGKAIDAHISKEAAELRRRIIESDPEAWEKFVSSQQTAMRNSVSLQGGVTSSGVVGSNSSSAATAAEAELANESAIE